MEARISRTPLDATDPSAWYDRAFGDWYLKLYPHRSKAESEEAAKLLSGHLAPGAQLLDIGTGAGRYLQVLTRQGFRVLGVDRSLSLLRAALAAGVPAGSLVRGDMRQLPVPDARFDGVLSMFTSFGYFETPAEHTDLLAEFRRVTAPAGTLVLDYLNSAQLRRSLVPRSERTVEEHRLVETRRIDELPHPRVVKEVTVIAPNGQVRERYEERVLLFSRAELEAMLAGAGWRPTHAYGSYAGAPPGDSAPRLILVAAGGEAR